MSTEHPKEVLVHARWRFTNIFAPDPDPFDPARLLCYPKAELSRCDAWVKARKHSKRLGVRVEPDYEGWRKCHTENYWAWYALDLERHHEERRGTGT